MAANTGQMGFLPSGGAIFCTIPDILYLPELLFGGTVWCLIAATHISPPNPIAYVITVSLFCFVMTFLWMMIFACGSHCNKSSWAAADVAYHAFAALLYLSASVLLAWITIDLAPFATALASDSALASTIVAAWALATGSASDSSTLNTITLNYKLDIAAVVFSFFTTLLYVIHTIFSAIRWKSF